MCHSRGSRRRDQDPSWLPGPRRDRSPPRRAAAGNGPNGGAEHRRQDERSEANDLRRLAALDKRRPAGQRDVQSSPAVAPSSAEVPAALDGRRVGDGDASGGTFGRTGVGTGTLSARADGGAAERGNVGAL